MASRQIQAASSSSRIVQTERNPRQVVAGDGVPISIERTAFSQQTTDAYKPIEQAPTVSTVLGIENVSVVSDRFNCIQLLTCFAFACVILGVFTIIAVLIIFVWGSGGGGLQ